jgi:hypothetical protein
MKNNDVNSNDINEGKINNEEDKDEIIESTSEDSSEKYICKKCNKIFSRKYTLTRHNLKHCKIINENDNNNNINILNNNYHNTNNNTSHNTNNIEKFNGQLGEKKFGNQWFTGKITYDYPYFTIKYVDGDYEDLDEDEAEEVIKNYKVNHPEEKQEEIEKNDRISLDLLHKIYNNKKLRRLFLFVLNV